MTRRARIALQLNPIGGRIRRRLVRLGLGSVVATCVLLLAPGLAAACAPEDPQGEGQLDICQQSFGTPFPTANGETVTDYAIEYIPKGAVDIHYGLAFNPNPSKATKSMEVFEPNATSMNPDKTFPHPGPNEQAARVEWSWTANDSSSPSSGTATYAVTFEEKVLPLKVDLFASSLGGARPSSIRPGKRFYYYAEVVNPNDDPVYGSLSVEYPRGRRGKKEYSVFHPDKLEPYGVSNCHTYDVFSADCRFDLAAGEGGFFKIFGHLTSAAPYRNKTRADAIGHQISDLQLTVSNIAYDTLINLNRHRPHH